MIKENEVPASWYCKPVAERSVIALCLKSMSTFVEVSSKLSTQDFLDDGNRALYTVLCSLSSIGLAEFDLTSVANGVNDLGVLEEVGGYEYIDALFQSDVGAANLDVYVNQILDASVLYKLEKTLIKGAGFVRDSAPKPEEKASSVISSVEDTILSLSLDTLKVEDAKPIHLGLREKLKLFEDAPATVRGIRSGFKILDRITNGFTKGSLSILAARPKIGKCITLDSTLVDPASGSLIKLGNVGSTALTLSSNGVAAKNIYGPVINGIKDVFSVETVTGRRIKVTSNHPFLSAHGWGTIEDGSIYVGARIAIPSEVPVFGNKSVDTSELSLLAYWLSEGNPGLYCISAKREDVINDIYSSAMACGFNSKIYEDRVSIVKSKEEHDIVFSNLGIVSGIDCFCKTKNITLKQLSIMSGVKYTTLRAVYNGVVPSLSTYQKLVSFEDNILNISTEYESILNGTSLIKPLQRILNKFGCTVDTAFNKKIPPCVFELDRQHMSHFINRLFSGDGWVTSKEIGYSSSSEEFIDGLSHLLLRFGIVAIKSKRQGKYKYNGIYYTTRPNYVLSIHKKKYLELFISHIGCVGRKKEIEKLASSLRFRKEGTVFGNPPKELVGSIVDWAKRRGISESEIGKLVGFRVRRDRGTTIDRLIKITEAVGCSECTERFNGSLFWDEVANINYVGKEIVADIQILDGPPNFIANDIVVHNSTLLMNWGIYMCITEKIPVLFIDTEMPTESIQTRMLSAISGVPERIIVNGLYVNDARQSEAVYYALSIMDKMKYFHKYMPGFRIEDVKSMARKYKVKEDIGAFIFDYIKMVELNDNYNETQTLGYLTSSLKDLAGVLDIPVISAVQLKRDSHEKSRVGSDDVADSDKVLRYCNTLMALTIKKKKEIDESGIQCGTHRLQILDNRGGNSLYSGIDLAYNKPTLTVREAEVQSSESLLEQKQVEEENLIRR